MPARFEPMVNQSRFDRAMFAVACAAFLAVAGFLAVMAWRTSPDVAPVVPVPSPLVVVTAAAAPTWPVDANGVVATVTPTPLRPTPTMVPYVWPTATVIPDTLIDVEVR